MKKLRPFVPVAVAGLVGGGALLLVLRLVTPASAHAEANPWVVLFRSRGFEPWLYESGRQAARMFAIPEKRDEFRDPELSDTMVYKFDFSRAGRRWPVQILVFPTVELGERLFPTEERQRIRWAQPRSAFHAALRVGRYAIIVTPVRERDSVNNPPQDFVRELLETFERRARELTDQSPP